MSEHFEYTGSVSLDIATTTTFSNLCVITRRHLVSFQNHSSPSIFRARVVGDLVSSGIPIAMLAPGTSIPMKGTHGFRDATSVPDAVAKWIKENPEANYCIPTGSTTGLWALDIDMPDGFDELQNLWGDSVEVASQLAQALLVRTPSGGCHLWMPAGSAVLRSGKMPRHEHVEIKADNTALTGPFSLRKATEKKQAGDYLPTAYNPIQQLQFLGFSKAIRNEVVQRLETQQVQATPSNWLAKAYSTERAKQVSIDQSKPKGARVLQPLRDSDKEDARRSVTKRLQPLVTQFIEAPDGHDTLARDLMWKLAHFEKVSILSASQRDEILVRLERETLYSNGVSRIAPYPIRGKWESTWRKLSTCSMVQVEQTATALWRDLERTETVSLAYAGNIAP